MIIYVVKKGDSVYSISQKFNVSSEKIVKDNVITEPDNLVVGQALVISINSFPYQVRAGESLYSISKKYGLTLDDLIKANPEIVSPSQIFPGETVIIPLSFNQLGRMLVNGYAFPNIKNDILEKTLPYLTYLSLFGYQVNPDGTLSEINDTNQITAARDQNVAPIMVVTNINMDGGFDGEIPNEIFSSEEIQQSLINNIIEILQSKNYSGVDIDFEYLYPSDRENYNNFLRNLKSQLEPLGYSLTTALAPKVSADQQGILYEAHDYKSQGEIVDRIMLMTYEWGYTYGPPLAVSPINSVRQVLDYAVTEIPPEKILMGIPNYGYDWTLPYKPGTMAQTISNVGAVDLARQVGSFIQYDEKSQAPYFYYYDKNGKQHIVWFEDARSIDAKLRLVNEYGLGGVSYWTINRFFPQNWLVQESLYSTEKILE